MKRIGGLAAALVAAIVGASASAVNAQTIYLGQGILELPSVGCTSMGPIEGQLVTLTYTPAGVGGNGTDSNLVIDDRKEFMSHVRVVGGSFVADAAYTSRTIIVDGQFIQKIGKVVSASANLGSLTGTESSAVVWVRLTNYLGTPGCVVTIRANLLRFGGSS